MALENYVKFLRGTPTAYQALTKKDNDTLYFISENNSSTGVLYLGNKLILGGEDSQELSLRNLKDVLFSENIKSGSLLVYENDKWTNKTIDEIFQEFMVMSGATAEKDGTSGLVPVPTAGQHNLFLRGDGTWADVGVGVLNTEISNLQNILGKPAIKDELGNITSEATGVFADLNNKAELSVVTTLQEKVGKLIEEDVDKSVRLIATEVLTQALIPEGASESLDTLQEIALWIQEHPQDASEMNALIAINSQKIEKLDSIVENLQSDIELVNVKVSSLESTIQNLDTSFVSIEKYNLEIGDITKLYTITLNEETGEEESVSTNITDEILALREAMKWQEM